VVFERRTERQGRQFSGRQGSLPFAICPIGRAETINLARQPRPSDTALIRSAIRLGTACDGLLALGLAGAYLGQVGEFANRATRRILDTSTVFTLAEDQRTASVCVSAFCVTLHKAYQKNEAVLHGVCGACDVQQGVAGVRSRVSMPVWDALRRCIARYPKMIALATRSDQLARA